MPIILNVDKSGVVSETKILSDKVSELYKKMGHKTADKMEKASAVWSEGVNHIHVYGKTKGRAGSENKYEFPPPIDQTLFFGNVLIVLVSGDSGNEKIVDLTLKVWEVVYERLFGGFEDLVDSDGNALSEDEESEEDCEDSELEGAEYTKDGYVKDDFIVDDSDDLEEEDEDYELQLPKKKKVAAKKVSVAVSVVAKKAVVSVSDSVDVDKKENKKKVGKKKDEKVEVKIVDKVDKEEAVKKETKKKVSKKKGTEVAVEESVKKETKKESKTKGSKKKGTEVAVEEAEVMLQQEKVEKKVKKESRKKKILPSLESAVFDDHEEELETLGHISEELAEEEYV